MKKRIIPIMLFTLVHLLFSQAPVVSNVGFSQRADGSLIVDIYYDLSDTDGETKKIEVEASDDDGSTWNLPCASLTGDVGPGVSPGTGRHVVWNFHADNPNRSGSAYKVRVTASETGTMTGNDGRTYQTVKIGNQWWMAENLRETKYRDHSDIPEATSVSAWTGSMTGARCAYDNNETHANTYGYLYNWHAVNDSRNIAPAGWHVPLDAEWTTLTTYLGGTPGGAGGKLKEAGETHWQSPNTGATNVTGFTCLPGGCRFGGSGSFYGLGSYAYFWSSTEYDFINAWHRRLVTYDAAVYRSSESKLSGFSIRLVRD